MNWLWYKFFLKCVKNYWDYCYAQLVISILMVSLDAFSKFVWMALFIYLHSIHFMLKQKYFVIELIKMIKEIY